MYKLASSNIESRNRKAYNTCMWQKLKNIYHLFIALLANIWFGFPSRNIIVIGVTGTDGKTTTTSLIYHILKSSGKDASMISSVGAIINGKKYDVGFHVTTPSSFGIQKFLKKAAGLPSKNKSFMVLETTSHALDQHRVFGIKFDIGVLTNVTHEHLDYHKTYDNYLKTKAKLLEMAKVAVINRDDESYKSINSELRIKNLELRTYGIGKDADVNLEIFPFKTKLIGEFNKYNILAAIAVCKQLGISEEEIRKAIESFSAPLGREDVVYKKDFVVMIDFAHTPNAFEKILSSLRKETKGRIIHVFGSAGKRDRTKRPLMGKISSSIADVIILTQEDPRGESIQNINKDIEKGISKDFEFRDYKSYVDLQDKNVYFKIDSRTEAISFAINVAKKGDLVLLTGKSHEKSMNYGHGEEPWDEYEAVSKALRQE